MGGPRLIWGGVLGGCKALGGLGGLVGPNFFACYTYILILRYSRNIECSNYCWGVPMWRTPLGGPPRGPWGLHRGPRVSDSSGKNCKFSQILCENCTCIKIPQIITLTSILGHFGHWGWPGKVKIFMGGWEGVFRKRERWFFF